MTCPVASQNRNGNEPNAQSAAITCQAADGTSKRALRWAQATDRPAPRTDVASQTASTPAGDRPATGNIARWKWGGFRSYSCLETPPISARVAGFSPYIKPPSSQARVL